MINHVKSNSDHTRGYTGPNTKVGDIFGGYPKKTVKEETEQIDEADSLNESKSSPLYHFTSFDNLVNIITTDELRAPPNPASYGINKGVSVIHFTRDYNRQFLPRMTQMFSQSYGLRINQDLLTRDYGSKLAPGGHNQYSEKERQKWLSDPANAELIASVKAGKPSYMGIGSIPIEKFISGDVGRESRFESEENLKIPVLSNLHKYITGFVLGDNPKSKIHADIDKEPDALTNAAKVLMGLFTGTTGFKQRNWFLDTAINLNVPIIYRRNAFNPAEIKSRIIQLYSQRNNTKFHSNLKKEEYEQIEEGRPSQQHPLEGHPYHKKTNAELEYISKDARAAGEAMKSHGTASGRAAENKYADQANDSATVRHFRKTSGMPSWYKKKYDLNESELEESNGYKQKSDVNHGSASVKAPGTGEKLSFLNKMYPNKKKQPNGAEFAAQRRVNRIADSGHMDEEKKSNDKSTPFTGPYKKATGTVTDKSGAKHTRMSVAKDLAKKALKKVSSSMVQKEQVEKSFKAKLIKKISKGKESPDKFQAEPELSKNTASGRNSYTDE
jgi:hypothetical protein